MARSERRIKGSSDKTIGGEEGLWSGDHRMLWSGDQITHGSSAPKILIVYIMPGHKVVKAHETPWPHAPDRYTR